jgi:hypothetical protein
LVASNIVKVAGDLSSSDGSNGRRRDGRAADEATEAEAEAEAEGEEEDEVVVEVGRASSSLPNGSPAPAGCGGRARTRAFPTVVHEMR